MKLVDSYPALMLALCIWREARGENIETKKGVGCVIRNRGIIAPAQGFKFSYVDNVLKPWAFSSFNAGDPNATKFPGAVDPSWLDSCEAAEAVMGGCADVTNGAHFYFSPPLTAPPHAWGNVAPTAKVGNLNFYKLVA